MYSQSQYLDTDDNTDKDHSELAVPLGQAIRWKELFDEAQRSLDRNNHSDAYFKFREALRVVEDIGVEWIGYVETLERTASCSMRFAMLCGPPSWDDEYQDPEEQAHWSDCKYEDFEESVKCLRQSLAMLQRVQNACFDSKQTATLRRKILTSLHALLTAPHYNVFIRSDDDAVAKASELEDIKHQLQFLKPETDEAKLEPLEESLFTTLSAMLECAESSYYFSIEYATTIVHLIEQLGEQIKSVYGIESVQNANVLETLALRARCSDKQKCADYLNEALRIRIKVYGMKHASTANTLRYLASLRWDHIGDSLTQRARKIEEALGIKHPHDPCQYSDYKSEELYHTRRRYEDKEHEEDRRDSIEKEADDYLNDLFLMRIAKRPKALSHQLRYKRLIGMLTQARSIAEKIEEVEQFPINTVSILSLLSRAYKRVGDHAQARRLKDEHLGMIARCWGRNHDKMTKTLVEADEPCNKPSNRTFPILEFDDMRI